ncbi:MAG: pimeloyl-ACP methyl ester carboxylesterase [Gammaproteobacteria bacterium]|jgi:pimeloyl-ACP methyl ester carboxylesterase
MPTIRTDDGVNLYYEEAGSGTPIVFVHEFAGDLRSYEPQMRFFSRSHRCIAYNARGYEPSDVPQDAAMYSQERAADDIRAVLDALSIDKAHIVGVSMGGFAAVHFGLRYADRALSLAPGGCGYGSPLEVHAKFAAEAEKMADSIAKEGIDKVADTYAVASARVQYQNKDPRGWAEFKQQLKEHSTLGSANTMRGYQSKRSSLFNHEDDLRKVTVPMLVMVGDEDDPAIEASVFLKRVVPSAGLVIFPKTGHALNLEEPDLYHQQLLSFFQRVEGGRWDLRDPRSVTANILTDC